MPAADIVELLGGQKVLKRKISNAMELHERILMGLPYAAFDSVRTALRLTREEAATAIGIPERTLVRRKKEKKFTAPESDRLLRLARVAALAVQIFGTEENAAQWMKKPNFALGSRTPFELLETDAGVKAVEDVLWHIAYGIIS